IRHTKNTQVTLARPTHLSLLNPSPPVPYFPLRNVLSFFQYNLVNAILDVLFLSFTVNHLSLQNKRLSKNICK
ncbi:unnamed protein product, partial [Hymenolepis diminuta]